MSDTTNIERRLEAIKDAVNDQGCEIARAIKEIADSLETIAWALEKLAQAGQPKEV